MSKQGIYAITCGPARLIFKKEVAGTITYIYRTLEGDYVVKEGDEETVFDAETAALYAIKLQMCCSEIEFYQKVVETVCRPDVNTLPPIGRDRHRTDHESDIRIPEAMALPIFNACVILFGDSEVFYRVKNSDLPEIIERTKRMQEDDIVCHCEGEISSGILFEYIKEEDVSNSYRLKIGESEFAIESGRAYSSSMIPEDFTQHREHEVMWVRLLQGKTVLTSREIREVAITAISDSLMTLLMYEVNFHEGSDPTVLDPLCNWFEGLVDTEIE